MKLHTRVASVDGDAVLTPTSFPSHFYPLIPHTTPAHMSIRSTAQPHQVVAMPKTGMSARGTMKGDTEVPEGHVWLQGDNLSNSTDSRHYGPVPLGMVQGRVVLKIWPLHEFGRLATNHPSCNTTKRAPAKGATSAKSATSAVGAKGGTGNGRNTSARDKSTTTARPGKSPNTGSKGPTTDSSCSYSSGSQGTSGSSVAIAAAAAAAAATATTATTAIAAAADVPARTEERATGVATAAVAEAVAEAVGDVFLLPADENADTAVVVRGGFTEKNNAMNNARTVETGVGQPSSTVVIGGTSDNNAAV